MEVPGKIPGFFNGFPKLTITLRRNSERRGENISDGPHIESHVKSDGKPQIRSMTAGGKHRLRAPRKGGIFGCRTKLDGLGGRNRRHRPGLRRRALVFRSEIPKDGEERFRRGVFHYQKTARVLSGRFALLQEIVIGFRRRPRGPHSDRPHGYRLSGRAVFQS